MFFFWGGKGGGGGAYLIVGFGFLDFGREKKSSCMTRCHTPNDRSQAWNAHALLHRQLRRGGGGGGSKQASLRDRDPRDMQGS